jgi:hypothetical protein
VDDYLRVLAFQSIFLRFIDLRWGFHGAPIHKPQLSSSLPPPQKGCSTSLRWRRIVTYDAVASPAEFLHCIGSIFILSATVGFVDLTRSSVDSWLKGRGRSAFLGLPPNPLVSLLSLPTHHETRLSLSHVSRSPTALRYLRYPPLSPELREPVQWPPQHGLWRAALPSAALQWVARTDLPEPPRHIIPSASKWGISLCRPNERVHLRRNSETGACLPVQRNVALIRYPELKLSVVVVRGHINPAGSFAWKRTPALSPARGQPLPPVSPRPCRRRTRGPNRRPRGTGFPELLVRFISVFSSSRLRNVFFKQKNSRMRPSQEKLPGHVQVVLKEYYPDCRGCGEKPPPEEGNLQREGQGELFVAKAHLFERSL